MPDECSRWEDGGYFRGDGKLVDAFDMIGTEAFEAIRIRCSRVDANRNEQMFTDEELDAYESVRTAVGERIEN